MRLQIWVFWCVVVSIYCCFEQLQMATWYNARLDSAGNIHSIISALQPFPEASTDMQQAIDPVKALLSDPSRPSHIIVYSTQPISSQRHPIHITITSRP